MRWHKRTTSEEKIAFLAERPWLFSDYKHAQREAEKRVFAEMKKEGLIAPSTGIVDCDIHGYVIMAQKRAKLKYGIEMASQGRPATS